MDIKFADLSVIEKRDTKHWFMRFTNLGPGDFKKLNDYFCDREGTNYGYPTDKTRFIAFFDYEEKFIEALLKWT